MFLIFFKFHSFKQKTKLKKRNNLRDQAHVKQHKIIQIFI
jgi:hypothetical protein